MGLLGQLRQAANRALRRRGLEIIETDLLYNWQRTRHDAPSFAQVALPPGADSYLRRENQRLLDLTRRYMDVGTAPVAPLVWADGYVGKDSLAWFRGDNPYVWQLRGQNMNEFGYALTTYYVRAIDRLGLLELLVEDGAFGAHTFNIAGLRVSRDLLDSIVELYFLDRHLGLFQLRSPRILDVGAGYGRLAHRAATALPSLTSYYCTDAVAVSTFICEYYLRHREIESTAHAIPLDEIDGILEGGGIDLAVNIHSFSECSVDAIDWWIGRLSAARVDHLFIVPNISDVTSGRLLTVDGKDFGPTVCKHGYKLVACEPKYRDPIVQTYGISPVNHFLFRLG